MNYRHNRLVQLIAELFTILGAAVDPTESFTSPSDNKRADLVLWMIGVLGDGAVACDVTVWSDFTMARLGHAANCPNFVLDAAEKMKNDNSTSTLPTAWRRATASRRWRSTRWAASGRTWRR